MKPDEHEGRGLPCRMENNRSSVDDEEYHQLRGLRCHVPSNNQNIFALLRALRQVGLFELIGYGGAR